MNSANDKYGSSLDRTLGAGKPVDPATRLSELLAQSLEELTRPFDSPRPGPGPHPARQTAAHGESAAGQPLSPEAAAHDLLPRDENPDPSPEESRIDADKALAELEAELFAAAKQVDGDASIAHAQGEDDQGARDGAAHAGEQADGAPQEPGDQEPGDHPADAPPTLHEDENREKEEASLASLVPASAQAAAEPEAAPDADAERVIARVRRLMLVSLTVTLLAVGSVFGLIGYRIYKGEGTTAKTADKLPEASAIPTDVTLTLPRGARVVQSAVANDRLLITLEIDGKLEVRTFDVKTLQPAGRLNFSATP